MKNPRVYKKLVNKEFYYKGYKFRLVSSNKTMNKAIFYFDRGIDTNNYYATGYVINRKYKPYCHFENVTKLTLHRLTDGYL